MITQLPVSDIECHAYPWDGQFTPDVLGAWEGLLEMLPQPPLFLQPAWTQAGCAAGLLTPWRSLVIKRDGDVVGLLLLERRTRWSAAIAAGCSPDLPPWLIAPGAEAAVHAGIAAWLQQESALGTLALGRHADPEFAQAICGACGWRARRQPVKPTFTIALPDTWEAYLDSLGSATRRTIRRREARLYEKCPDVDVEELTEPSAADAALSEIIRLYCHRWADELGGCMLDNGEYAHFYRQAVRWALEQGHGVIFTLRARGRLLAGQVAFYTPEQETLYCDLNARDLDEEFGKYSPGTALHCYVVRWALERGVRKIDLSFGNEEHKRALGANADARWEISIARSAVAAQLLPLYERTRHILERLPVHVAHHWRRFIK